MSETSANVPGTCSDTGECLQEVSAVYHQQLKSYSAIYVFNAGILNF